MSGTRTEVQRLLRMVWNEAAKAGGSADTRDARQWLTYAEARVMTLIEQEAERASLAATEPGG